MRQARYLYSELSSLITARRNCLAHGNTEWLEKHTDNLLDLVKKYMPSGSGVDSGTKFDLDASHGEKLIFQMDFHHMDESGMYDGWTEHQVIVTPSLANQFHIRITGRNRNDIKDYLHEMVDVALREDVRYDIFIGLHHPDAAHFATKYAITRRLTLTCPFCKTEATYEGVSYVRDAHTCDAFPGDKSNPHRYQPMNETLTWLCNGRVFPSWRAAQVWAGAEMEAELFDKKPTESETNNG